MASVYSEWCQYLTLRAKDQDKKGSGEHPILPLDTTPLQVPTGVYPLKALPYPQSTLLDHDFDMSPLAGGGTHSSHPTALPVHSQDATSHTYVPEEPG